MTLRTVTPENARRLLSEGAILLDIRETDKRRHVHSRPRATNNGWLRSLWAPTAPFISEC